MTNSSTGGYLQPSPVTPPLDGQALNQFLQQWIVGISGLPGNLVRPAPQSEPPDVPDFGTCWAAYRYEEMPGDIYPYVDQQADGSWQLQRHEELHLRISFYDDGVNGQAQATMRLFRDGTAVPQNLEILTLNNMAFSSCGAPVPVPSLLKQRWLYRVDLPLVIRRQIIRMYPVLGLESMDGELVTDTGLPPVPLIVEP